MAKVSVLDGIFNKALKDTAFTEKMIEVDNSEDVLAAYHKFVKGPKDEPYLNEAYTAYTEATFKQGFKYAVRLFLELQIGTD